MAKDRELSKFYEFLAKPLFFRARFALGLLVIPLIAAFFVPLWRIELETARYPGGLTLELWANALRSGHGGADLREINILNHYIGMRALDAHDFADLTWLPFALGVLAILTLRCAAIGDVRSLVDVFVTSLYVGGFAVVRFVVTLGHYGGELDPDAPVRVPQFAPPMLGSLQVGDVTTHAGPGVGAYLLGTFALGVAALLVLHLVLGRKQALGAPPP